MALLVGRSLGHLLFFLIALIGEPVYEDLSKCLGANLDWPFLQGKAQALHRTLVFKNPGMFGQPSVILQFCSLGLRV